jgi:hypothetical protein
VTDDTRAHAQLPPNDLAHRTADEIEPASPLDTPAQMGEALAATLREYGWEVDVMTDPDDPAGTIFIGAARTGSRPVSATLAYTQ